MPAAEAARTLQRHYVKRVQETDAVKAPAMSLRAPGRLAGRSGQKRVRPKKQDRSRNFILAILREAMRPLTNLEILRRMVEERRPLGRMGVSHHLNRLGRAGKAAPEERRTVRGAVPVGDQPVGVCLLDPARPWIDAPPSVDTTPSLCPAGQAPVAWTYHLSRQQCGESAGFPLGSPLPIARLYPRLPPPVRGLPWMLRNG